MQLQAEALPHVQATLCSKLARSHAIENCWHYSLLLLTLLSRTVVDTAKQYSSPSRCHRTSWESVCTGQTTRVGQPCCRRTGASVPCKHCAELVQAPCCSDTVSTQTQTRDTVSTCVKQAPHCQQMHCQRFCMMRPYQHTPASMRRQPHVHSTRLNRLAARRTKVPPARPPDNSKCSATASKLTG